MSANLHFYAYTLSGVDNDGRMTIGSYATYEAASADIAKLPVGRFRSLEIWGNTERYRRGAFGKRLLLAAR